jgi:carbon-monoxide dehydrogenase large subunit
MGIGDANARLRITEDGMVSLLTTYADTGTGAHTIRVPDDCRVLDVPFDQVKVEVGTTDSFHSESGTGASRVTLVLGQAVLNGAEKLKTLLRSAALKYSVSAAQMVIKKPARGEHGGSRSLSLAQVAAAAASKASASK